MHRSKIEWVLNPDNKTLGWVWNPLTGCLNHVNGMCKGGNFPCYAYRLAHGRLKERYKANINVAPVELSTHPSAWAAMVNSKLSLQTLDPFYPRFWPERVLDLTTSRIRKHFIEPRGIFVCDMGELFGDWIPESWQEQVFYTIKLHKRHRFYVLTKQPQNLLKFSPFPSNAWVGVTATNSDMFDIAFRALMGIQAKVKYISLEPLLDWTRTVNLERPLKEINWLIIGAQTKPYKPPKLEWVEEIVRAADKAGIKVFLKDNLMLENDKALAAGLWNLERRQEIPC